MSLLEKPNYNEVNSDQAESSIKLSPEEVEDARSLSGDPDFRGEVAKSDFFSGLAKKFKKALPIVVLASAFVGMMPGKSQAEGQKIASIEVEDIKLSQIKNNFNVPDKLRDLAKYEQTVEWYVNTCDHVKYLAGHMNDLLPEERDIFLKNVPKLTAPSQLALADTLSGRMFVVEKNLNYMKNINDVYGEAISRRDNGVTIEDMN